MEGLVAVEKIAKMTTTTLPTYLPKCSLQFQNLPEEVQVEIFSRLSMEDLAMVMCVSKPWRQLIVLNCLPMMASSLTLNYYGLLLCRNPEQKSSRLSMIFNIEPEAESEEDDHFIQGPYQYSSWCSKIMQCKATAQKLLDCSNGLLLFCHREGKAEIISEKLYYYYVINPITKQCVAILKPNPKTTRFMYACLAYDPSESSYFRIVQFQGHQLKIFSSENGEWITQKAEMPNDVAQADWENKSVYHKGAIYRISSAKYVVKFRIDAEEKLGDHQVVAIKFPATNLRLEPQYKNSICVRNKKIILTSIAGKFLFIWELKENFDGGEYTYDWSLLHQSESMTNFENINIFGQLFAIHPYIDTVILKMKTRFFCYHYSENKMNIVKDMGTTDNIGFPLLECTIPFTCCLDKMNTSTFKRLTIPKTSKKKDKSVALI